MRNKEIRERAKKKFPLWNEVDSKGNYHVQNDSMNNFINGARWYRDYMKREEERLKVEIAEFKEEQNLNYQ